jgi:hypothetical protein
VADFRSSGVLGSEYIGNQPLERVSTLVSTLANQNTPIGSDFLCQVCVYMCVYVYAGLFSEEKLV